MCHIPWGMNVFSVCVHETVPLFFIHILVWTVWGWGVISPHDGVKQDGIGSFFSCFAYKLS